MLDRAFDSFARAVRNALPWIGYCGIYEYRVFGANPPTYELRPTVPASGLPVFGGTKPDMGPVSVKPGVPGVTSSLSVGALVLVSFIDCDPARPFIVAVGGPGDAGFLPTGITYDASGPVTIGHGSSAVSLGGGFARVLRDGEQVTLTSITSTGAWPGAGAITSAIITIGPAEIIPGAPPTGFSTVTA